MMGEHVGKCFYCNKLHDLRVGCPEYISYKKPYLINKSKFRCWLRRLRKTYSAFTRFIGSNPIRDYYRKKCNP